MISFLAGQRQNSILLRLFVILAAGCPLPAALAQAPLPIYTDHLVNGFDDWSWASHNLGDTNAVHSGKADISVTAASWEALSFHHADFDTTVYDSLSFWANGGSAGGQLLQIYAELSGVAQRVYLVPGALGTTWRQYVIPLTSLAAANKADLSRISFQLRAGGSSSTFYIDDVQLTAKPAPPVHVNIDAAHPVRTVDARMFGVNTAVWDRNFDTPQTVDLLNEAGLHFLRFPGGSLSDEYHWASNRSSTNTWQWDTSFTNFVHVATNIGAQVIITVNYGSGTAAEAAAWVRRANVENHYGFKYWEIGNECYGTWETDTNLPANDAYTYALRARDYLQQMKAVDPTIRIGVVAAPGEDSYVNSNSSHPALNPRTGQTHYGWTPVLLSTLKSLGVTPDFLIHHRYPEYTDPNNPSPGSDSDPFLLQTTREWKTDVADLRQQISDYFGDGGTNIELLCTENNSDAGAPGRQSTSLVNGLYYADSLGQLMQTELNSLIWWDLRNGADTRGSYDSTLYGWRTVGDLGMIGGLNTRYPPFYAAKLIQYFARGGDVIVSASSDYPLVSAYAARRADGTLTLLVINKDTVTNFTAQITLAGFNPDPQATLRTFGIPQDEAARTNGTASAQDLELSTFPAASTNFNYSFPPLSLTLLALAPASSIPASPSLVIIPLGGGPDEEVILQLQGQPGTAYVLQSSPDLAAWTAISTNTLTGSSLNLTNPLPASPAANFYRAFWQP